MRRKRDIVHPCGLGHHLPSVSMRSDGSWVQGGVGRRLSGPCRHVKVGGRSEEAVSSDQLRCVRPSRTLAAGSTYWTRCAQWWRAVGPELPRPSSLECRVEDYLLQCTWISSAFYIIQMNPHGRHTPYKARKRTPWTRSRRERARAPAPARPATARRDAPTPSVRESVSRSSPPNDRIYFPRWLWL